MSKRTGTPPHMRNDAIADLPTAGGSTTAAIETKINAILAALRNAGIVDQS